MNDKLVAGVCGGIAKAINLDASVVRICFALALLSGGIGLVPYLYAWILMPKDNEGGDSI